MTQTHYIVTMRLRTRLLGATLLMSLVVPAGAASKPADRVVVVNKSKKPAKVKIVGTPTFKLDLSNGGLTLAGFPPIKLDPEGNGVTIVGTPPVRLAGTPSVKLDPDGNQVRVTELPEVDVKATKADPLLTRETPEPWGATKRVVAGPGGVDCEAIPPGAGRVLRIESVQASVSGGAAPVVGLRALGLYSAGVATWVDLDVPTRSVNSVSGFTWVGSAQAAMIVSGDGFTAAGGMLAEPQVCVRAPAGNSATAAISVSGTYLR